MARKTSRRSSSRRSADINSNDFEILRRRVDECESANNVQFKRIAQLQSELDDVRRAWMKLTPPRNR
jgi:hypothetical protein